MKKVLIIGESCRDIFVYCESNRLCPDVPVPVLNVIDQTENGGMAMNVKRNIEKYVNCDIVTNSNWYDVTKTRYVHDKTNHMFLRVDSNDTIKHIDIKKIKYDYELIVISDYDKGFLKEDDIEYICEHHDNVFIDTKKVLGRWVKKAKFIKINDNEYNKSKTFITKEFSDKIIHTKGGEGCEYLGKIYPVNPVEVKDVSGAGDSFLAALVVNFLKTNDIEEAIIFANKCASEVVKHRGVTMI